MDAQKAKIAELEQAIADLRAKSNEDGADQLAIAREINGKRAELTNARAELAELEAAFADDDADDASDDSDDTEDAPAEDAPKGPEVAPGVAPAKTTEDEQPGGSLDPTAEAAAALALAASGAGDIVSPTAQDATPAVSFTLTAGGGMAGGVRAGSALDRDGVLRQLQASTRAGMAEGRGKILSINRWGDNAPKAPGEHLATIENTRLMRDAIARNEQAPVLTAGGCFCGPDEQKTDFGVVGRRGRPVRDIFPSTPINGGFSYYRDLAINPDSGSVQIWTCDDQVLVDAADDATWKQCSELDCFTPVEVIPYMIPVCTTVQRTQAWAHPEQVDTWLDKIMLEYDRLAERQLLDLLEADAASAGGIPIEVGTAGMAAFGALPQFLYALGAVSHALGYQFRDTAIEGHVIVIPRGLLDVMLTDELLRGFPSGVRTKGEIRSLIEQAYGVRLVERLDESTSQAAASAATVTALNAGGAVDAVGTPMMRNDYRTYILRPDQFVHGEGEMVNFDWHTDDALLRQNKMRYFGENVEVLERTGLEHTYILDINGSIRGSRVDLEAAPAA